jgi:transcriptional regulator with XRE-family HTH domain
MINTNLKFWRRELGLTQAQLADKLNIKRSLVGAYEEGRAEPRLATLVNMARLFNIPLDSLATTDFTKRKNAKTAAALREAGPLVEAQPEEKPLRVLAFTVGPDDKENIELVPLKAAAGYLNGYADREFIEELPRFRNNEQNGRDILNGQPIAIHHGGQRAAPGQPQTGRSHQHR